MSKLNAEMNEATKLVLYGWGYPDLFNRPDGKQLQNRLVMFPLNTSPAIEGAPGAVLNRVLSRLEMIKAAYLEGLKTQHSGINPAWVWVDTPEPLSDDEILGYRTQFEDWTERIQIASIRERLAQEKLAAEAKAASLSAPPPTGNLLRLLTPIWERKVAIALLLILAAAVRALA